MAPRWEEIQVVFDDLVELDALERASRLATLGSSDPELRTAVESLLAADAEADARLASLEAPLLARTPALDYLGLAGRTISHFRVLEPLGAGGMGIVYRAEDTRLGRAVALKFLLPQRSPDAAAKARFLREARSAAALDHANLCTLHEVGETEDGRLFLAMPLYPGETLKAHLDRSGPLPVQTALEIARQAAQGLKCAHTAGIVHRDLKPSNVMLLPDGTVKILDFGLAKARDESVSSTGGLLGTVAYMAPEQIRGEAVDTRADLWALGVVLYEMLTGKKPFRGDHEVSIAHAIVHEEPTAPTALREALPVAVEEFVLTLLQKDLRARYATVDEVIAELVRVGGVEESTGLSPRSGRRHARHGRAALRKWRVPLVTSLVISAVAAAVIVRSLRSDSQSSGSRYSIALPNAEALAVSDDHYYRIAISPDGERLVYVGASPEAGTRLWIRTRDQLHATAVAGTEGAVNPFFSPDGSRLGFVATAKGAPAALKVVRLGGGTPTMVTDSAVFLGGAAWGHDGYIYFDGGQGSGIERVRETGGVPESVTTADRAKGEWWHYQPEPLPNGRGVLFVISHGIRAESDIAVLDLKSGVYRTLLRGVSPRYAASGHLLYATVGGTLMAAPFDQDRLALAGEPLPMVTGLGVIQNEQNQDLAISATGTLAYTIDTGASKELVWVTRDGTAAPIDSTWRGAFTSVALSPNGAELAAGVIERTGSKVWIKQLDQGPASRLGSVGNLDDLPAWTADGRSVTFLSNGGNGSNPGQDLYVSRSDGSSLPELLLDGGGKLQDAEISSDGNWLVYRTNADLFAIRAGQDGTRIPLVVTPFLEASPRLSPDGRWLAYTSDESSSYNVYVRPFPNTGSARWRVSPVGGADPIWSRNGRELFYKSGLGSLVAAAVIPGASFAVGKQQVLFSIGDYTNYWQWRDYDVSPDGRRFVMIRPAGKPRADLIMVKGFFAELRARFKH